MAKGTKTARELEDMMMDRVGIGGVFVAVRKEAIIGWNADVVTAPAGAFFDVHTKVQQIVTELRELYDLRS
jgi:hypothetical protein